ncbi:flagellar export chaperone FliS [Acidaminobacter sp. JC074]|nr:flagellar export chaperone FliS [Acidaminobacter sp. JC074]
MPKINNNFGKKPPVFEAKKQETKADPYLEQKIMAAKPEELTLMLYEGMVKFLKQGILYNDQKNIQKTHNSIMRAEAIINELNVTLDENYEISKNLSDIYMFMKSRLMDANLEKDSGIIREVLDLAVELRDTWKEAMQLAK